MEHQRDIHNDSWNSRKPDPSVVIEKARIKATLSLLEEIVEDGYRVFDLGCGDGTVGDHLKSNYKITIDGCDISEVAVDRAQKHYQTVYRMNIDDEDIPVEAKSYDVVICTDVLEHTLSPIHSIKEIQRILKDDGVTVISIPNYSFIRYRIQSIMGKIPSVVRDDRHYSMFTESHLRNLLNESGLEVQTVFGVSRLQKLANISPQIFAKTIIVVATTTPQRHESC